MAALMIQNPEGITLTEFSRAIDRELSALSQAAGRLRKQMADNKSLQENAKNISDVVTTPKCQALTRFFICKTVHPRSRGEHTYPKPIDSYSKLKRSKFYQIK